MRRLKPGEDRQYADYVFLCGVMWAQYASEDAARELVRALSSEDPDVAFLASALLEKDGGLRLASGLSRTPEQTAGFTSFPQPAVAS